MTAREEWHLDTRRLGRRVLVFDRLDSTSNRAASLAGSPANDGVVVLADEQTAGRGQYGRSWLCPPGSGVLLSVLLFPPPALCRPVVLTAWAAVAVCETVREVVGLEGRIKWPNDVLLHGRKVCGILIEAQRAKEPGPALAPPPIAVVVGIGLNVNQPAESFLQASLPEAASLAVFSGRTHDGRDVARRLIGRLDAHYDALCAGDLATLEACWRERLGLLGEEVVAECPGATHRGRLRRLTWDALVLVGAEGEAMPLRPETVKHLAPA
jgi:BirA family biotin operon repressor/biotin-[acetyl-CoA-carboxylase] ligase